MVAPPLSLTPGSPRAAEPGPERASPHALAVSSFWASMSNGAETETQKDRGKSGITHCKIVKEQEDPVLICTTF